MQQALALARQALGTTSPNPSVGAVIVKDGKVVGAGCTQPPGSAHAEIMALRQAGEDAHGATLYVTLEPCSHYGRTPPCAKAIIAAGISEVHMSLIDPNPLVSGKGKAEMEAAGIRTIVGEGEEQAREIIESFARYITTSLPFISAKYAVSLDGKIATRTGDSRWITGPESRKYVHELRRIHDAVLAGVNTLIADDPRLTVRDEHDQPAARQPLRIIADSMARTPLSSSLLKETGKTLIVLSANADAASERSLRDAGAETLRLACKNGLLDIGELLRELGRRQVTNVLVEGGGEMLGYLFDHRLVDKVYAFVAPVIIGGKAAISPVSGKGVGALSEAHRLNRVRTERLGQDTLVIGYPQYLEHRSAS